MLLKRVENAMERMDGLCAVHGVVCVMCYTWLLGFFSFFLKSFLRVPQNI